MLFMRRIVFPVLLPFLVSWTALAQTSATELDVSSKDAWVDTGLDLRPGDRLTISATGTLKVRNGK